MGESGDDQVDRVIWDAVDKETAEIAQEVRARREQRGGELDLASSMIAGGPDFYPVVPWRRRWAALRLAWRHRHEKI